MSESVERQTLGFSSKDGKSQIKGLMWQPAGTTASSPRGIVQIVHGMSEHIGRYDEFARFLAQRGFVVCGHDHIGHGKSAPRAEDRGHMPVDAGADILVEDVGSMRSVMGSRFARSVPYFIFGHSMGSFVVRNYLTRYGAGLSGAIICGTGNKPRVVARFGSRVARSLADKKGERYVSPFLHSLADGAYGKAVRNARTSFDWLSYDEANVDAYIADEMCGCPFTVGAYASLFSLVERAARLDLAMGVPKDLPMFYIAGAEDPVGDNGDGVRDAIEVMRAAGVADIKIKLYEGMRHEILNETGRDQVFEDVLEWLEGHGARKA